MKYIFSSLFFILGYIGIFARPTINLEKGQIHVGIYCVDSVSNNPIEAVFVQTNDRLFSAYSDNTGFVDLKNFPASASSLNLVCIGYKTMRIKLTEITKYQETPVVFLSPTTVNISEVVIKAPQSDRDLLKSITDLDIYLRPINNSQEVLRMIPGLFIGQHAGGGKAEQIFLRGFDLDHGTDINISVDGMPVNMVSHAHGQGYSDLHFVIPEFIDKVNFNKGPYYAENGNFTTAGFVEFKIKDYLDRNFAKIEVGEFDTYRGVLGLNLLKHHSGRKKQSLYFAGEASFSQGYFDLPQDFNRFNGMLKYKTFLNDNNTITALLSGFTSKWNASGQIPNRAVEDGTIGFFGAIDSTEGGHTSRLNANILLESSFQDGSILKNQIYLSKYKFELYSNFTFNLLDPVNGDEIRQKENRLIAGYNGSFEKSFRIGNIKTKSKIGLQARYDYVKDIELTRVKNNTENIKPLMFGDVHESNIGVYGSQNFNLSRKLKVTVALRGDYFLNEYNDELANEVNCANAAIILPKLNINYQLSNNVQLYSYNGRGFHSNDTRVVMEDNGRKILPPAYGSDLGGVFKIGKKTILQTAIWYLWLDQEFVYVGDEGVIEPSGQSRRMGFDLSLRREIYNNIFADINVNYARPRFLGVPKPESYIPLAPSFTSTGGITYNKGFGWNVDLRYRWMGDRPANEDNSVVANGYFILDATLNYTKQKWEVGIAIQNLLNTRWKETQFDTTSKLPDETNPVEEIHFTPGTPFFGRVHFSFYF